MKRNNIQTKCIEASFYFALDDEAIKRIKADNDKVNAVV